MFGRNLREGGREGGRGRKGEKEREEEEGNKKECQYLDGILDMGWL